MDGRISNKCETRDDMRCSNPEQKPANRTRSFTPRLKSVSARVAVCVRFSVQLFGHFKKWRFRLFTHTKLYKKKNMSKLVINEYTKY